ncbi:hypothetical protein DV737_g519, partial [Chaetothyriales sp. CBS 132003]
MTSRLPLSSSTAITSPSQLVTLATCYPAIATAHYKSRLKDPAKIAAAIQRDNWRYDQLPAQLVQSQKPNTDTETSISLDLPDLEKLVQWKITHGHSRPFLPAMIRKNDSDTVKKATAEGAVGLGCVDIEKAAFAAMHLDLLSEGKERAEIELLFERPGSETAEQKVEDEEEAQEAGVIKQAGKRRVKSLPKPVAAEERRHSKRVKR